MVANQVVFLFDVDNTLLDNDGVIDDLMSHLKSATRGSSVTGSNIRATRIS